MPIMNGKNIVTEVLFNGTLILIWQESLLWKLFFTLYSIRCSCWCNQTSIIWNLNGGHPVMGFRVFRVLLSLLLCWERCLPSSASLLLKHLYSCKCSAGVTSSPELLSKSGCFLN
jgi:hypothetical protein